MRVSTSRIRARSAIGLAWDVEVPDTVKAIVHEGWVTLEGTVQWFFQKAAAERSVRYLKGRGRTGCGAAHTHYTRVRESVGTISGQDPAEITCGFVAAAVSWVAHYRPRPPARPRGPMRAHLHLSITR